MLHVAIVNAVYPPEPVVSAQMGRDLAVQLAKSGAQVTVLCPIPTRPMGTTYSDYMNNHCLRLERKDGVQVVRLPSFTASRNPGLSTACVKVSALVGTPALI